MDEVGGFIGNMNKQVEEVCSQLKNDEKLNAAAKAAGGKVNAIGFSQGGQLMRAYVQRCNDPPVANLVTFGGQHMGVADIPGCVGTNDFLCKTMAEMLGHGAYLPGIRDISIQAQYFRDPMLKDTYLKHGQFLPDINNEKDDKKNTSYKDNLTSLDNLVLIKFLDDVTVVPNDSSWFEYFPWATLDRTKMLKMNETDIYTNDWIGLKTLDKAGKVTKKGCPGGHMQITMEYLDKEVIQPYLKGSGEEATAADHKVLFI